MLNGFETSFLKEFEMKLRILGSGTIMTPSHKNCSGYLINEELLLDCGPGIWRSLALANIINTEIKYIVLSHFHADHVSDLAPFLLERYLQTESLSKKLILVGPAGFKNWFIKFSDLFGHWMQKMPLEIFELQNDLTVEEYTIKAKQTFHTDNSICIRVEDKSGKSLFYSGDSGEQENLTKLAKNCHLGIFEASNTEDTKIEGHLTPISAAKIAQNAGIKKMVLTHFYPEVYKNQPLKKAASIFKGKIIEAKDNLIIHI